jgi:hypothetical protein
LRTEIKKRLERLEQQAQAERCDEVRIAWVDEDGRIVGYTIAIPPEERQYLPNGRRLVDYRQLVVGGKYYVECAE